MSKISNGRALLSLSPLVVFLGVFAFSSAIAGEFGGIPVSAAFLLACIYAMFIIPGPVATRIETFSKGAGHPNLLLMIWIFILAGAFAGTAKDMGAVDATVNLALKSIPPSMLYSGLFITACFISMSIGTSVGTIVALAPVASGLAAQSGSSVPYMTAIVVGGAFFGDNLSFISDTTIAATRAVGCEMKDKFKTNISIVAPAVVIVTTIYLISGSSITISPVIGETQWYKIIPYLMIIGLALCGLNVLITLFAGIAACAAIGFATGDFTWTIWIKSIGAGIASMGDLVVVTMLAGGLLETIRAGGGMDWAIDRLTRHVKSTRGAEATIAALVCFANICTANNTIAIITTGDIARDISERFGVKPRRAASILDTFSCLIQGLLPYGPQLMMASVLAGIPAVSIIPHLYYPYIMGAFAIIAIAMKGTRSS